MMRIKVWRVRDGVAASIVRMAEAEVAEVAELPSPSVSEIAQGSG